MKTEDLGNLLLGLDMLDSLMLRASKLQNGMRAAIQEKRDLTDDELAAFRADAEEEDTRLEAAVEARRQREVVGGDSDKVTGETGGDIRP